RDGAIKLHVNGKEVSGVHDCTPSKGYIALQSEGSECHFKNIRIKELPPSADQGFVPLFNGKDLKGWETWKGEPAGWLVQDGYLEVVPGKGNIMTKEKFGPDFQLHVEFWLPLMADKKDQGRANSGVYLQGRYEIQVLDSYNNEAQQFGSV